MDEAQVTGPASLQVWVPAPYGTLSPEAEEGEVGAGVSRLRAAPSLGALSPGQQGRWLPHLLSPTGDG